MAGIDIKPDAQGKVRDLYDLGDKLLLVATDRISAFDYILEDEIPHKGEVLTRLSCFWFELLDGVVDNHLISATSPTCPSSSNPTPITCAAVSCWSRRPTCSPSSASCAAIWREAA